MFLLIQVTVKNFDLSFEKFVKGEEQTDSVEDWAPILGSVEEISLGVREVDNQKKAAYI